MSESMTSADEGVERVGLALGAALAPVGPPVHLDNPHTLLGEVAGQPGTVGTSVHPDRRSCWNWARSRIGGSVHAPDPVGWLLFNVLAMIAEFESDLIRMRTREDLKVAKAPRAGCAASSPNSSPRNRVHLVELWRAGSHSSAELAELFSVARSTVYRAVQRGGEPPPARTWHT